MALRFRAVPHRQGAFPFFFPPFPPPNPPNRFRCGGGGGGPWAWQPPGGLRLRSSAGRRPHQRRMPWFSWGVFTDRKTIVRRRPTAWSNLRAEVQVAGRGRRFHPAREPVHITRQGWVSAPIQAAMRPRRIHHRDRECRASDRQSRHRVGPPRKAGPDATDGPDGERVPSCRWRGEGCGPASQNPPRPTSPIASSGGRRCSVEGADP